jgi:hypothetical protein
MVLWLDDKTLFHVLAMSQPRQQGGQSACLSSRIRLNLACWILGGLGVWWPTMQTSIKLYLNKYF